MIFWFEIIHVPDVVQNGGKLDELVAICELEHGHLTHLKNALISQVYELLSRRSPIQSNVFEGNTCLMQRHPNWFGKRVTVEVVQLYFALWLLRFAFLPFLSSSLFSFLLDLLGRLFNPWRLDTPLNIIVVFRLTNLIVIRARGIGTTISCLRHPHYKICRSSN